MAEPANTPIPASTPRSASPHNLGIKSPTSPTKLSTLPNAPRPRVLHVGAGQQQQQQQQQQQLDEQSAEYAALSTRCDVVAVSGSRDELLEGLRAEKWSRVDMVLSTTTTAAVAAGLAWDAELVGALPRSVQLVAADAELDEKLFKDRGIQLVRLKTAADEGGSRSSLHSLLELLDGVMVREKPEESKEQ